VKGGGDSGKLDGHERRASKRHFLCVCERQRDHVEREQKDKIFVKIKNEYKNIILIE
jgi:hypothetical protein